MSTGILNVAFKNAITRRKCQYYTIHITDLASEIIVIIHSIVLGTSTAVFGIAMVIVVVILEFRCDHWGVRGAGTGVEAVKCLGREEYNRNKRILPFTWRCIHCAHI